MCVIETELKVMMSVNFEENSEDKNDDSSNNDEGTMVDDATTVVDSDVTNGDNTTEDVPTNGDNTTEDVPPCSTGAAEGVIKRIMTPEPCTTIQTVMNNLLQNNHDKCIVFIRKFYQQLKAKSMKCKYQERSDQAEFYRVYHKLVTSDIFQQDCSALFQENEHAMALGLKIAAELRHFIISRIHIDANIKASNLSPANIYTPETLEVSVKAKMRYIAGWAIAGLKKERTRKMRSCKDSKKKQDLYKELKVLETITRSEAQLDAECTDNTTRSTIQEKQNNRNGLTNVSDAAFDFNVKLLCKAKNIYNLSTINTHKGKSYSITLEKLKTDKELYREFIKMFSEVDANIRSPMQGDVSIPYLLKDITDVAAIVTELYDAIVKKVTNVVHAETRRRYLDQIRTKRAAHRTQVMIKGSTKRKRKAPAKSDKSKPTKKARNTSSEKPKSRKARRMNNKRALENDSESEEEVEMECTDSDKENDLEDEDNETCFECGEHDTDADEVSWIACDRCQLWYHEECTGFTARFLESYTKTNRKWVCKYCSRS